MTALVERPSAASVGGGQQPHLTFARVLRSEWIKLRTVPSTIWTHAALIVFSLGVAALMASTLNVDDGMVLPAEVQAQFMMQVSSFGVLLGQLIVAILGVISIGGEYRTGMIRTTLMAVPRRSAALWAKTIVMFATTFVVGVVAAIGSYLVASPIMASKGISAAITEPDVLGAIFGGGLYLALVSVFALMVGAIVRSSAGGIGIAVGVILVLPLVFQMIPAEWATEAAAFGLSQAGLAFIGIQSSIGTIVVEPWHQLLVVVGWAAAATIGAVLSITRRDA